MARNGSGTYSRLYDFTADRDSGSPLNVISADRLDGEFDDISTALTASIAKDGQTTPTANLPMGGFKHTSVSTTHTARAEYLSVAAMQDNSHLFIAGSGTDTITATYAPAVTSLVSGMELCFRAAAANATTTPSFSPNGLTAKTIVKNANTALIAGDIAGQHHECRVRYNATTDKWHLLNPAYPNTLTVDNLNALTTDSTGGATLDLIPFVDASDSNASNKVLTTDLFKNVLANFTAKAAPTVSDTVMVADAAASGAAKISTLQQVFDAQNGLTNKATPTTSDRIQINDAAASGAAKYSTIANIRDILVAAASDQETGTSAALFVTPSVQHRHQSAAKAWINLSNNATDLISYNVSGTTDTGVGQYTVTILTDFSTDDYVAVRADERTSQDSIAGTRTHAVGSLLMISVISDGTANETGFVSGSLALFGDHT